MGNIERVTGSLYWAHWTTGRTVGFWENQMLLGATYSAENTVIHMGHLHTADNAWKGSSCISLWRSGIRTLWSSSKREFTVNIKCYLNSWMTEHQHINDGIMTVGTLIGYEIVLPSQRFEMMPCSSCFTERQTWTKAAPMPVWNESILCITTIAKTQRRDKSCLFSQWRFVSLQWSYNNIVFQFCLLRRLVSHR